MRGWICPLVVALALAAASRVAAQEPHYADAALRAVQFIDDKEGWAVGDEGVVWHTLDGGKSWARLKTGSRASLRSVHFFNSEIGWVAGREELPHAGSAGVLLFTRDGGLKWQRLLSNSLPGLNQVRFVDTQKGFLLGDATEQFPPGLFRTLDSGRSWEPVAGPRTTTWLGGDFSADGKAGLLVGAWGRLGKLNGDRLSVVDDPERIGPRDVRGVAILPGRAVAVAQGGLVLTSGSGGANWGFAKMNLPAEVLASLDFHAVSVSGKKVWVVGRPGSVVLHSPDAGESWQLQKTGQPLPLNGVHFFDERRGWAVGEAGVVLATADGGATWQSLRTDAKQTGAKRAAALVVQARAGDLPVDTLALLGAGEGYQVQAVRAVGPDPASAALNRSAEPLRYAAAARLAGGLSGEALWAFSLPQYLDGTDKKDVLDYWNRRHAQRAPTELLRQLVLALRVWRPAVVLGDHPQAKSAASALVGEALQEAVRQAADAKAFPEQIDRLGLEAWQVSKVYGLADPAGANVVLDSEEFVTALQTSPADHALVAAALLSGQPLPRERGYRLVQTQVKGAEGHRHLMTGIDAKAGECRREIALPKQVDTELQTAARERKMLLMLADRLDEQAQAQIATTLAKMPDDYGARTAYTVAAQQARRGRWELAQQTYLLMIERYPAHPLSAEAYRWLIRHTASGEARRRYELKNFSTVGRLTAKPENSVIQVEGKEGGKLVPAINQTALLNPEESRRSLLASLEFGKRLAGFGPAHADPATQLCLQSARRALGEGDKSAEWFDKFRTVVKQGPWGEAAQAELWLSGRGQPPARTARCRLTDVRPYLDGDFDDPCWKNLKPMVLANAAGDAAGDYPTQAWLAYDQEFLYVALQCKHPKGKQIAPVKARPRDADVESFDRVSILLDLDRDYATFYQLQIDQRGCVRDDCCGDLSWNPRWYVAIKSMDDCWQIEAAIPLGELTGQRVSVDSAWAFNVVRIVPGRGVTSWSQPADVRPRAEGMSLLQFQRDANSGAPMPKAP